MNLSGLYDLKKEINKEYSIGYSYFDECFGINIDFNRKSYEEDNLKPQDILTLMFSFKNIGSYKSTNLAVSESDKQDINWEGYNIDNEKFEKIINLVIYFYIFCGVIFLSNKNLFGTENKIIFKINNKAFTTLDYVQRLEYLDFVGNNQDLDKDTIINDYISANLFLNITII